MGWPWQTSSTSSGMTSWRAICAIFQVSQMRRRTKSIIIVIHCVTCNSIEDQRVSSSMAFTSRLAVQLFQYPLNPLLLLQQHCHHDGLKRPGARHHDPGLHVELGTI